MATGEEGDGEMAFTWKPLYILRFIMMHFNCQKSITQHFFILSRPPQISCRIQIGAAQQEVQLSRQCKSSHRSVCSSWRYTHTTPPPALLFLNPISTGWMQVA